MTKNTSRNGKIDLLRMIFSLCVLLNHAKHLFSDAESFERFNYFSFAVEFFFLVSGYLMMASIEKRQADSSKPIYQDTVGFLSKKIKSVFVEATVAYVIGFFVVARATELSFLGLFANSWTELFFISSGGIVGTYVNPAIWYISSMLLSMAIIYPIIRRYGKLAANVILPVVALLILAYMSLNYYSIRDPHAWMGVTLKGNLRAFAEISLGALCYHFTEKLKRINFTFLSRLLLTGIEFGIYALVLLYMTTQSDYLKDIMFLALLCVAVCISFAHIGVVDKLLDNKLFYFLGKFSLPLYLSHNFFACYLSKLIPSFSSYGFAKKLTVYISLSIATAIVVMIISKLIRKFVPLLWNKARPIFVK